MYDFSIKFDSEALLKDLGYKRSCLVRNFKDFNEYRKEKAKTSSYYLLGVELRPKSTRDLIMMAGQFKQADYLTINNPNDKILRAAVEKGLIDSVSGLELISGHDRMHQRATLLDNVAAKFMNKNRVSMVIEFANLKRAMGLERAIIYGRMRYNTRICIKKRVPVIIASGAKNLNEVIDPEILKAFGQLLGMNAGQAKQSLTFVQEKIINRN